MSNDTGGTEATAGMGADDVPAMFLEGFVWQFRKCGHGEHGYKLNLVAPSGKSAGTVYLTWDFAGFNWFVWDENGVGGENSKQASVQASMIAVERATERWNKHTSAALARATAPADPAGHRDVIEVLEDTLSVGRMDEATRGAITGCVNVLKQPAAAGEAAGDGERVDVIAWALLMAAAKSGDEGTIRLAAQLAGAAPCEKCGFVNVHCRCPVPPSSAPPAPPRQRASMACAMVNTASRATRNTSGRRVKRGTRSPRPLHPPPPRRPR
jgi:hypothetical protein